MITVTSELGGSLPAACQEITEGPSNRFPSERLDLAVSLRQECLQRPIVTCSLNIPMDFHNKYKYESGHNTQSVQSAAGKLGLLSCNKTVFIIIFSKVDDDGTLPDFPRRVKASISFDAVQFSTDKIHKAIQSLLVTLKVFPHIWLSS